MKKKWLKVNTGIFISLLVFGCAPDFKTTLYDASNWVLDEFAKQNPITLFFTTCVEDDKECNTSKENEIRTRTFIIDSKESYNKAFKEDIEQLKINFDEKFIILYEFSDVYKTKLKLEEDCIENNVLKIKFTNINLSTPDNPSGYPENSLFTYKINQNQKYYLKISLNSNVNVGKVKIGTTPVLNTYTKYESTQGLYYLGNKYTDITYKNGVYLSRCIVDSITDAVIYTDKKSSTDSYSDMCLYLVDPASSTPSLYDNNSAGNMKAKIKAKLFFKYPISFNSKLKEHFKLSRLFNLFKYSLIISFSNF